MAREMWRPLCVKGLATAVVAVAASCFAEPRIVDEAAFPRIGALAPRTAPDPKDDQERVGTDPAKHAFYRAFRDFNSLNDLGSG